MPLPYTHRPLPYTHGEAAIAGSSRHERVRAWKPETSTGEKTGGGAGTLRTPGLETPAVGPSADVRPRATGGGGGKAGNRDNSKKTVEEEAASIIGGGVATDDDVRMEVATDITSTSGGAATLHTPVLETTAAGPSARVRPMVTNGGGGKAGNRDEKDATSGGVATLHTPFLETPADGPSARVRPRVTDGGGVKADDKSDVEDMRPRMGIFHRRNAKYEACNTDSKGPRTSMHSQEPQRETDDDGRTMPMRGKYEVGPRRILHTGYEDSGGRRGYRRET